MSRHRLSAVVTTMNNEATLQRCLASLGFCDEIVVLDSGSSDATERIARGHCVRWQVQPFVDYGSQKQAAVDLALHDWVLLLDADEQLTEPGRVRIESELQAPRADGYRLPRTEWLFWRWSHRWARANWQLRLFRRSCGGLNAAAIHAAPVVTGKVIDLAASFLHFGEAEISVRADKVNRYSSGLVAYKRKLGLRCAALRMVLQPPLAFLKMYVLKRYFLNGWAGFIAARLQAHYTFLKYAKLYESQRRTRDQ